MTPDVFAAVIAASGTGSLADAGGLIGFAATVIETLGEWGVGLLALLETLFPPIPSEVILPLAGFLSYQGQLSLWLTVVTATLGGWIGGLLLYWLAAVLGLERSIWLLSKVPLIDREDIEKAAGWFHRHGRPAIFFGRLIPGVRSLISLPAGADRMNLFSFSLFTILGSGIWNVLLVGLGSLLGTQYELVARYADLLNYIVYAVIAGCVVWLVIRRVRRRRRGLTEAE
jgi:membrane protein DedA with SNARE-associated domain